MKKIITWIDLQGSYRVTSPAYDWLAKAHGFSEDEAILYVWAKLILVGGYGIPQDHPLSLVEDADQRERLAEIEGQYFRYPANRVGRREGKDGAWEMDTDGRPKVNMPKARGIHMDHIRNSIHDKLRVLDSESLRALEGKDIPEQARINAEKQVLRDIPQTFDLTTPNDTPLELRAMWPTELGL